MNKRSELITDIKRVVDNYKIFCKTLKPGQKMMSVLKADAYGHGAIPTAIALEKEGCTDFGVATVDEAIELRENGVKGTILVLGYTPASRAQELVDYDVHQTIVCKEHLQEILDTGVKISAHFKIDTGMHRIGFNPNDETEELIRKSLDKLSVKGIFTHLCVADDFNRNEFTYNQLDTFKAFAERLKDLNLPFIHCHNSAGVMYHNDGFSTHLRLGISLFGLKPDWYCVLPDGVLPCLEWKTQVAMVKELKKGDSLGYGLTFTAEKDMKIATLTTGYSDGYPRKMSNLGTVYVNGKKGRIVGRVCMDQMMADVTGIDVKMGDTALLLCDDYTADDMAKDIGTIAHEIATQIMSRVTRTYKNC